MDGKVRVGSILFHCFEFERMYQFWRAAMGYVPREQPEEGWVVLTDPEGRGPNISLDRFPRRREGKRSRIHLDLYTTEPAAEVERLLALGASRYPWRYPAGADYVVLADPDDNLFCVVGVPAEEYRKG
jgi:hypothetical protein